EGKIEAIKWARENKIPFFGICLGMQMAVVEFARHIAGLEKANSSEFDKDTPYAVIDLMADQRSVREKGGTMRLGAYPCVLGAGTVAAKLYGAPRIAGGIGNRSEGGTSLAGSLAGRGWTTAAPRPTSAWG